MGKEFCSVIIVAAGSGTRISSTVKKQFLCMGGKEILAHTIEKFQSCDLIDEIILVTGESHRDYCENEIVSKYMYSKVKKIVCGGKERQNSVYNGLKEVNINTSFILVHDGVRPFVSEKNIVDIITQTKLSGSSVLAVRVKDTIKVADQELNVSDTPQRDALWAVQTPQCFTYELLTKAYERAFQDNYLGTDDSVLVERLGMVTKIVEGSYENIKITTQEDLMFGEYLLQSTVKE